MRFMFPHSALHFRVKTGYLFSEEDMNTMDQYSKDLENSVIEKTQAILKPHTHVRSVSIPRWFFFLMGLLLADEFNSFLRGIRLDQS